MNEWPNYLKNVIVHELSNSWMVVCRYSGRRRLFPRPFYNQNDISLFSRVPSYLKQPQSPVSERIMTNCSSYAFFSLEAPAGAFCLVNIVKIDALHNF